MPWFKVDDGFHSHPKVIDLPLEAAGLWAKAGSWSADQLTDGFVPNKILKHLGGKVRVAEQLVTAKLWEKVEDGYQFHDWKQHQPTKTQVLERRDKTREKVRKFRERNRVTDASSNPVTEVDVTGLVTHAPSRPVPSLKREESARADSANGIAHQLTVDFHRRYLAAESVDPNARSLGSAVQTVVGVLRQKAEQRGCEPESLIKPLLDGFFGNDTARAAHFAPAYLATNPLEYLEPRARPLKPAGAPAQAVPRIPEGVPPIRHWGPREETG
ncbi:hypothetical protein EHM76_01250 [bacterium]|nr:MAG: hypothetical protein EHM76_01250 [bacterium]